MPWLTIISFILSFIMQKKAGKSTGAAALGAAGIAAATYFLADPSNPDNLFKIGVDSTKTASATAGTVGESTNLAAAATTVAGQGTGWSGTVGKTVDTVGGVLKDWGPTGTALVVGTAGAAASGDWVKWGLIAAAAYLIIK